MKVKLNNLKLEIAKHISSYFSSSFLTNKKINFDNEKKEIYSSIFRKDDFEIKAFVFNLPEKVTILNIDNIIFGICISDEKCLISLKSNSWYEITTAQQADFLSSIEKFANLYISPNTYDISDEDVNLILDYINYCFDTFEK